MLEAGVRAADERISLLEQIAKRFESDSDRAVFHDAKCNWQYAICVVKTRSIYRLCLVGS